MKSYRPPISDTLRSGMIIQNMESKHLFKIERFSNTTTSIFVNADTSHDFLFLKRSEHEGLPFSITIFDGAQSYYISDRDSSITQYPATPKSHSSTFNSLFFTRWLTKDSENKNIISSEKLRDTVIDGVRRKYFITRIEADSVRLDVAGGPPKSVGGINSSRIDYFYVDSLSHIIRQDDYSLLMKDTQITISELKGITPLSAAVARGMIFDTLQKYLSIYKSKAVPESRSKKQNAIPPDSIVGSIFPATKSIARERTEEDILKVKSEYVLLDFSYAGCMPCRLSAPAINELHHKYSGRGLSVIGLNPFDDEKQIDYTMKKDTILYPIYPIKRSDAEDLGVSAYPSFFLLDKKRNIRAYFKGYSSDLYKRISDELEKIMKE